MTRYANGANLERRVKADLQKHGWEACRVAGSRGLYDIKANAPGPQVIYVQCKRDGRMSLQDRRDLENLANAFDGLAILAYLDDGIQYSRIDGDGYKDWVPE